MPDIAGNSLGTATQIYLKSSVQNFPDTVTPAANDYYRFNLSNRSSFNLSLTNLTADANVTLLDSTGNPLSINGVPQTSSNPGRFAESINTTLDAGTYYILVSLGNSTGNADYSLNIAINNNLTSDILWRNYATGQDGVWLMNGVSRSAYASLPTVSSLNQKIQGAGDFNQDGQTDIVWRDYANGDNLVWLMNGISRTTTVYIKAVTDPNWQIVGVGDFNGDSKSDLVWQNQSSGQNLVWLMNGLNFSTSIYLPSVTDPNWEINGVGDFNGDNKSDLVWRNQSTGQDLIWLMNGTTLSSKIFIKPVNDPNWSIQEQAILMEMEKPIFSGEISRPVTTLPG